jgi:hypothetical protein
MFHRETRDELQSKLAEIDAEIASHPLNDSAVKEAQAVVDANGGEKEAAARELAERGLPSLEELGKLVATGTASWWNLHRKRNKVVKKLS